MAVMCSPITLDMTQLPARRHTQRSVRPLAESLLPSALERRRHTQRGVIMRTKLQILIINIFVITLLAACHHQSNRIHHDELPVYVYPHDTLSVTVSGRGGSSGHCGEPRRERSVRTASLREGARATLGEGGDDPSGRGSQKSRKERGELRAHWEQLRSFPASKS
ncbi:hypothetical protein AAFF_G00168140 [Aldrovandia affinis]|uniref:Uncharacterized protein n=1 Tax=Aldrovandia affinis TaxID=143900 RepID=A0AAD7W7Y4_9TELE|nr:hypothetical protein AAFF_G00168140 [Aldrovandia affinis]